jgi:hypothetical protein
MKDSQNLILLYKIAWLYERIFLEILYTIWDRALKRPIHTQHAVPMSFPCHAVNSHMPCPAPAMLRQCRVLREIPRGSRKYPNC